MKIKNINVPTIKTITSRSSGLRAAFVKAIIPDMLNENIEKGEIIDKEILKLLSHTQKAKKCAYCAENKATEWDHFRPVMDENFKETGIGYVTDIYNIIPSCGKCNQSKGNSHWRTWIKSNAPLSPATRNVKNLSTIIKNLHEFEEYTDKKVKKFQLKDEELVELKKYLSNCEEIIKKLQESQEEAKKMLEIVKNSIIENPEN